jgi:hypothetical protein
MPSIEIACLDLSTPLLPAPASFAIACEPGLKSHRSPSSRFQADFDRLQGSLYHIGNPNLAHDTGAFFAFEVLSEVSRRVEPPSFLEFGDAHLESARNLLRWLLEISPSGLILFTSDWQFGPDWSRRFEQFSLAEFWALHDSRELLLNASYLIAGAV